MKRIMMQKGNNKNRREEVCLLIEKNIAKKRK